MAALSADGIKWAAVAVTAVAAVAVDFLYLGESFLYRILSILGFVAVAGFFAMQTTQGAQLRELMRDSRLEIRRVVWPTYPEALHTTFLIMVFVLLMALMLWGMDAVLGWLASFVLG